MNKPTLRKNEIAEKYLTFLDKHIDDVIKGKEQKFFRIKHIASTLAASHTHFTDTIKKVLVKHPCFFYDEKIIEKAKDMLGEKDMQPSVVAKKLTYDPSNFSKFFKKWTGETPCMYKHHFQRA